LSLEGLNSSLALSAGELGLSMCLSRSCIEQVLMHVRLLLKLSGTIEIISQNFSKMP